MAKNFRKAKLHAPNLPWCQDDPDKLGSTIIQFVLDQETYIRRWAQKWFENLNFIYGNQSIKWSQRYDFAVDVDFLRRESPLAQKSQTNISRVVLESLASFIYGNLPDWDPDVADESSLKGKRFRKVTEKLLTAYMLRLNMDHDLWSAALGYCAYGQMAARIDWAPNRGRSLEIPQWNKIQAPVYTTGMKQNSYLDGLIEAPTPILDSNGQPLYSDRWEPVTDANGRQIVNKMFAGDVQVDILTPFEYRIEPGKPMHKSRYIQHIKLLDYDEWLEEYDQVAGKTKEFEGIIPEMGDASMHAFAVRHFMRLKYITPPSMLDVFKRTESVLKGSMFRNKILVVEHFDRPNSEMWAKGRRVVTANGRCTHITEPSYTTNKLDGWHPFVDCQWLTIAPSSVATGPMNDVIAKNRETNVKDSYIATALRRNLGSMLLVKTGGGLDPQKLSGEPAQIHEVNDVNGAAAWLTDSNAIPPVLQQLKALDKEEIYEVSGAGDAMRGDRSKNVSAGYALRQLEEREQKRLTPAKVRFEKFVSGIGEKLIQCLKQNAHQLDDQVMGYMKRTAAGEFQPQDVVAFLSTPIDYGVDITVKTGSMASKSKASQQATLSDLAKGPLQQRLQQDAQVLDNYLKYFDAETLRDGSGAHRDRAEQENETFMDMERLGVDSEGLVLPKVLYEDDDAVHEASHTDWIIRNAGSIMSNEPLLTQILIHTEQHRIQKQEKKGEVMPGASQQVPGMMAQARQQPAPQIPVIYADVQQRKQQEQQKTLEAETLQRQKMSAAQTGEQKPPQAPREPAGPGGGPGPISPSAPSRNTPTETVQGGQP